MNTKTLKRPSKALIGAGLVGSLAILGFSAPSASATAGATAMTRTQRQADATLNSTLLGWYNTGTHLTLTCYKRGQAVTGYYSKYVGWDNLWYKTSDGGFVADVDIYTGTNNPVTPACPTSGRAVGQKEARNSAVGGQCTWGAKEQWRASTGYYPYITGNAKDWAGSARAHGWSVVLDAQPRSIVVFQPGVQGADRTYGHVAWVTSTQRRSDGLYVTFTEMNGLAGPWRYNSRTVKDVVGMSYILAP